MAGATGLRSGSGMSRIGQVIVLASYPDEVKGPADPVDPSRTWQSLHGASR